MIDHAYGLLKFNIINMSILTEMIYRFNATPIKTPADFTVEIDRLILKCIWKCKKPKIVKAILKKKNKEPTLRGLKT